MRPVKLGIDTRTRSWQLTEDVCLGSLGLVWFGGCQVDAHPAAPLLSTYNLGQGQPQIFGS
jgi:hypothetical protein